MRIVRPVKAALCLVPMLLLGMVLLAQEKAVTGTVTDQANGKPLQGVTVSVKGGSRNTTTNEDGLYRINASADAVLSFTYVGYSFQEVRVGDRTTVNIILKSSANQVDEVVVVGYGTRKRANVLGSVATINPKEIEDLPAANLSTALINKVPGVSIGQTSGKPGATTNLRIRNPVTFASTGSSINPLYVIDGIVYNEPEGKTFFDNLDATMVESISFLKDAAASIYGSRGANGVVLVTTKKGRPGKPRISYTGSYGISDAQKVPKTLSAFEHVTLLNNKYLARPAYNSLVYTPAELEYARNNNNNWFDEVWEPGYLQRHTLNVSGGTDKITFFGGANYLKETGNLQDLYATRYGVRIGMNAKITKDLTFDVSFSNDNSNQNRPTPKGIASFAGINSDQNDEMNATIGALMLIPRWVPMYINGLPVFTSAPGWHPKEVQTTGTYARTRSNGQNITANLNYAIPFLKGLSFRSSFGTNMRNTTGKEYYVSYNLYDFQRTSSSPLTGSGITKQPIMFTNVPTVSNPVRSIKNGNSLRESQDQARSYVFNQALNYRVNFGKHDLDLLVLAEQSESSTESFFTSVEGQVIPGKDELWAFTTDRSFYDHASSTTETGRASYLGRVNYSFNDKYLFEGTFRADASPNFPPSSRWGYFPSGALGWKISQEDFFKNNVRFINDLKIRAQVGLTGSDAVANYQYYERYTQTTGMLFGTVQTNGLNNNRIPNPDITWEKALYKNIGLDGTLLNRKFNFTLDYYNRLNYDMLQTRQTTVPTTLGITIADENYAKLRSWGVEGSLGYNGTINRDFGFNIQTILGWSDNKVLQKFYTPASDTGYKFPIGRRTDNGIEGYRSTRIFGTQAEVDDFYKSHPGWLINGDSLRVGYLNYEDINGDGRITELDRTRIANRASSILGLGFNIGANWKGLRLSINTSMSFGGTYTYDNSARRPATENQSALAFWKDSWSPTNVNAKYPVINSPLISETSTFWIVRGTVWTINNVQLSYALPSALSTKWHIPDLRAYVVVLNPVDILNPLPYKSVSAGNAVNYPVLRTVTFGLNVGL